MKAINTGQIAFLKVRGHAYETKVTVFESGKKKVDFEFEESARADAKAYWENEIQVFPHAYRRALDAIRQEIEFEKNN